MAYYFHPHNHTNLNQTASKLLKKALKDAFVARHQLNNDTRLIDVEERPDEWQIWFFGFLIITGTSIAAPIGILLVPLLKKSLYDRFMTFLVALGIGSMSGSCLFILIPQAFNITALKSFDYTTKSWLILCSIYGFFAIDRIFQFAIEFRRRKKIKSKIHISTLQNALGRRSQNSKKNFRKRSNETDETNLGKQNLQDEIEIAELGHSFVQSNFYKTSRRSSITETEESDLSSRELDQRVNGSVDVIENMKTEMASVVYMIIFGCSANNFVDGMSIGAAFSDGLLQGISIGLAVFTQQLPEGLGILAILVNSGLGIKKTLTYNIIPIILSYFGFVAGLFLDNLDDSYDDLVFSISAGMYFYIFLGTLIPEIRISVNELLKTDIWEATLSTVLQFSGISLGIFFMFFMSSFSGEVEQ